MKRKLFTIIIFIIVFGLIGCGNKPSSTDLKDDMETNLDIEDESIVDLSELWQDVSGIYSKADSGQYNNGVLQLKYLDNDCVMFEFRLMEGSESEDYAEEIVLPFVMTVDENDLGRFESNPDWEQQFTIDFNLSEDRKQVTITHTGDIDISPDGVYEYLEDINEVIDTSARSLLEFLPSALTSLNSNNGAYTLNYAEGLVAEWFYPVEATFDDTKAVLAKFLVAKDLSAVYRVDDDIEPTLIFGTTEPMLNKTVDVWENNMEENEEVIESTYFTKPLAEVQLKNGVAILVGKTDEFIAVLPWDLPYTISVESLNPEIVMVDENGILTGISEGEAIIKCTLALGDSTKEYEITVFVDDEVIEEDN